MSILELGLSIMRSVRMEYKVSNLYISSLIEQLKPAIEYFQEAEDIMSHEPSRARVHLLVERAKQRKKEAQELMGMLQKDDERQKLERDTLQKML